MHTAYLGLKDGGSSLGILLYNQVDPLGRSTSISTLQPCRESHHAGAQSVVLAKRFGFTEVGSNPALSMRMAGKS